MKRQDFHQRRFHRVFTKRGLSNNGFTRYKVNTTSLMGDVVYLANQYTIFRGSDIWA